MNIKQAKQEIANTLKAYLAKDERGNYRIPPVRQRPILLMGPPGIGKTQIMEQAAAENGVGLVAYTITHHTRQSALGLPFIEHRSYGGAETAVTEYTMSEILASVYRLMERTGLREGILFLDEINCVSETLAPMMLQFLQCKTFGNQPLPEGWLIVAAGNPPEYNKSVREFDVVTLDRVRRIEVTEDFAVWKEYAVRKGIHGAVLSYLEIKKDCFYRIETTADGLQFVTARGWEDLSELLTVYEALGLRAGREVVGQYLQMPRIAKDFANYLELYYKYQRTYHVEDILSGRWQAVTASELRAAPFDERLSVLGLLFARLTEEARAVRGQDAFVTALHGALTRARDAQASGTPVEASLSALADECRAQLQLEREAGRLTLERRDLLQRELATLEDYRKRLRQPEGNGPSAPSASSAALPRDAMEEIRRWFAEEVGARGTLGGQTGAHFDNAFRFLEESLGQSQEMVLFVTELTAGFDTSWYIETFGCDAYFRHNRELLFDDTHLRLRRELESL